MVFLEIMAQSVVELEHIPHPVAGAPAPRVVAGEQSVTLSYTGVGSGAAAPICRVEVRLSGVHSFVFGMPNDEALPGHALYARGLRSYMVVEVQHSEWLERVERANRVHPRHDPVLYAGYHHFAWTFQDSTFECIARSVAVVPEAADLVSEPYDGSMPSRRLLHAKAPELASLQLSLQRALLDEVLPSLRGVAVDLNAEPTIYFYFDGALTVEANESVSTTMAEALADLAGGRTLSDHIVRLDAPMRLPDHDTWVFRRRE